MNRNEHGEITTKVDSPVKIILNIQATSGYDWNPEYNSSVVKLIKKARIVNRKTMGAASKVVFNFQPLRKGDYEIVFLLKRPWEKNPIDKKLYKLHVR